MFQHEHLVGVDEEMVLRRDIPVHVRMKVTIAVQEVGEAKSHHLDCAIGQHEKNALLNTTLPFE